MRPTPSIEYYRQLLTQGGNDRYLPEKILGVGTFGVVVRTLDNITQERVAIKFIEAHKMHQYLGSEVCNHRSLKHPHIIRFKKLIEIEGTVGIIMEYANGSNLRQEVRRNRKLDESVARWIFQQLVIAVDYCHKKGIASRDIKCDNILLINGPSLPIVKLSDFGYSVHRQNQLSKSVVGTVDYMAPEIIRSLDGDGYDARRSDLWSCGVVLYVMLCGHYPFSSSSLPPRDNYSKDAIQSKICDLDFLLPLDISPEVQSLISHLLTNVEQRYTIEDILQDPWFKTHLPDDAVTLNSDILRVEGERKLLASTSSIQRTAQTNAEIEVMIHRALQKQNGHAFKMSYAQLAFSDIVTDEQIDLEIENDKASQQH